MSLEEELEKIKEYSLNGEDINDFLHQDTNIFTTQDLMNMRNIDECFDNLGRCIILYLTENDTKGHWISLIKKGNTIEYYDSYGSSPKNQGKELNLDNDEDKELNGDNIIEKLIKKSGYSLKYNKRKSQPDKINNNTCGRHAIFRTLLYKLDMDKYNKLLNDMEDKHIKSDDVITFLTSQSLGK